jgi:hypothetical protein
MGSRDLDPEQRRIASLIEQVSRPSVEILHGSGNLRPMRLETAATTLERALIATVRAQRQKALPTDRELAQLGGPKQDTTQRLLSSTDLGPLPGIQLATAVRTGRLAAPTQLIVEARTEPTRGPEKFGVMHGQPPRTLKALQPSGTPVTAANMVGGIATALVLADCGATIAPVAAIQIAQGYWNPASWGAVLEAQAERALRERAALQGPFVTTPLGIVEAILEALATVETLVRWDTFADLPITGGRLRLGYPVGDPALCLGQDERYLGCSLGGIRRLREQGLVPYLSLPAAVGEAPLPSAISSREQCDWTFVVGGAPTTLADLQAQLFSDPTPWTQTPMGLVQRLTGTGQRVFTLAAHARHGGIAETLTLVATLNESARSELFVTTLDPTKTTEMDSIVTLAASEIDRRAAESPVENAIASLLEDCHLQRHRRYRFPERRSFAGVNQAAYMLRGLARAG